MRILTLFYPICFLFCQVFTGNTHAQSPNWADKIPDAWIKYKALQPITDQVALYQKGELWGVVYSDGRELTPAIYSRLFVSDEFPDAIAIGIKNNSYTIKGLLSFTGQVTIAPVYASLHRLPNGIIRACGGDFRCLDFSPNGEMRENPLLQRYKSNGKEQNGLLCASEDGVHFGLLDAKGKWVIAPEHPPLWPHQNGWWTYENAGYYSRLLHPDVTTQETLFLGEVYPLSGSNYWKAMEGIWKKFDKNGRFVANITGFEPITYSHYYPYITIQNEGKKGLCDLTGKVVLEPVYRSVDYENRWKAFIITDNLGRKGLWASGTFKIPLEYDYISYSVPQFFAAKGEQTTIFSSQFETIVTIPQRIYAEPNKSFQWDDAVISNEDNAYRIKVLPENRKIWHSKNGLIPVPDKAVAYLNYLAMQYLMEDGTQTLCSDSGAIILENCDEIVPYRSFYEPSQVFLFRKNNLWGCADRRGKILFDPQFEQLLPLQYGYFLAQKDRFWGVLDAKGAWAVQPIYESYLEKPVLGLRKNQQWRIFDVESGQLSDVDLEHYAEKNGVLQGTINGIPVALNNNGKLNPNNDLRPTEILAKRTQIVKEENGRKALCTAQGKALTPFIYANIISHESDLQETLFFAQSIDGGSVILDTSGKELVRMDYIIDWQMGYYTVKKNEKWEILDRNLQQVGVFNAISPIQFHVASARFLAEIAEDTWVVKDLKNRTLYTFSGKIRIWDSTSLVEIEQEGQIRYQSLFHFDKPASTYKPVWKTQGFSILKKDNLYYVLQPNGLPLIEGGFEKWPHLANTALRAFQRKDSIVVIDQMGKIRLPLCTKTFSEVGGGSDYFAHLVQRRNSSGTEIWNTQNDRVLPSKSYQVIRCSSASFLLNAGSDNRYNLYDSQLQPLMPESVAEARVISTHLIAVQHKSTGKYHIYNVEEQKYTGQVYTVVTNRENDFWRAFEQGEFLMYHDTQLLFRRKCKSLDRVSFKNQRAFMVEDINGWQLIDYKGNTLCPEYFSNMEVTNNDFITVTKKDKKGVLSLDGKFLLLTEYDQIIANRKFHVFLVKKNGLWGHIQRSGKVILPIEFEELKYHTDDGLCIGVKNGRYGFYSILGQKRFDRDWEYADQFCEGFAAVRENGKWGYINTAGTTVIPCSFEYAHRFRPRYRSATVMQDGQFWDINDRGEKIRSSNGIPDFGQYFSPLDLLPNKADFEDYVNIGTGWQLFRQKSTRKYGLMDYSGKIRLNPEYDQLDFEFGEKGVWFKGKKDGKVVKFGYELERVE
jgi:hypothetical protein